MTRLVLVRHGETPSNLRGLLDTAVPGPGLTEQGRAQAAGVVAALGRQPIGVIYASTATRARLTAAPLAADRRLDVLVRDGIREIQAGDLEMLGDPDSVRTYLAAVHRWMAGDLAVRVPGGESGHDVLDRFDAVVAEATGAGSDAGAAVLVSHGGIIRMWATVRAVNLGADFGAVNPLGNTGIVTLDGDPAAGWRALSWTGARLGVSDDHDVSQG